MTGLFEYAKANDNHDSAGRFASGGGGGSTDIAQRRIKAHARALLEHVIAQHELENPRTMASITTAARGVLALKSLRSRSDATSLRSVRKANPNWADQPREQNSGRWTTGSGGDNSSGKKVTNTEALRTAARAFGNSIHTIWHKLPSEARHALAVVAADHLARHVGNLVTSRSGVSSDRIARAMRGTTANANDVQNHFRRAFGKSFYHSDGGVYDHIGAGAPRKPLIGSQSGARFADAMLASRQFLSGKNLSDYRSELTRKKSVASDEWHDRRASRR